MVSEEAHIFPIPAETCDSKGDGSGTT